MSSEEIGRLVLSRRYELLLTGNFAESGQARLVNELVSAEIDQRIAAFSEAFEIDERIRKWADDDRIFAAVDANVFLHHVRTLEELDFGGLLACDGSPVHILTPMTIGDELDAQKSRGKTNTQHRARITLRTLEKVCGGLTDPALRQKPDLRRQDDAGVVLSEAGEHRNRA